MPNHQDLIKEFELLARSAGAAEPSLQQIADRLHHDMARYNWVGFYLMETPGFNSLVLGPYAGSFIPTLRIPIDKGLCGAAARSGTTVVVNDVASDPRYLGSDLVKSNIVVPISIKGRVMAELCIESYFKDAFTPAEQRFIESCAAIGGRLLAKDSRGQAK
jgi:L-methionine (R)-S-oxide reductase